MKNAKNPSCRDKISELPGGAVVIVVIVNWQYNDTLKCYLFDEFVSWILCRVLQQKRKSLLKTPDTC
jgi:hypothetical protein